MKILIIPDVHGRDFWIEPCNHVDEFDKVIFLGDYHDPYTFQVTVQESRDNLKLLEKFITDNKDKVVCLLGNHDYSYITGFAKCRYDGVYEDKVLEFLNNINLKLTYKIDNYLFSHSGVLPSWVESWELDFDKLGDIDFNNDSLTAVSRYRGGYSQCSSCIWGDVREYNSQYHYKDIYQIFGHTQLERPLVLEDYACLDCSKVFILNTEEKKLYEYGSDKFLTNFKGIIE